jgi:hypothetical protein
LVNKAEIEVTVGDLCLLLDAEDLAVVLRLAFVVLLAVPRSIDRSPDEHPNHGQGQ